MAQLPDRKKPVHTREDFVWMMKVFGLMLLVLGIGMIPSIRSHTLAPKLTIMVAMLIPAILVFLRIAKSKREAAESAGLSPDEKAGWNLKAGFWFLFFISLQASLSFVGRDTPGIWTPWVGSGALPFAMVFVVLAYLWRNKLPAKWKKRTMVAGLVGAMLTGGVLASWVNISGSPDNGREELYPVRDVRVHYGRRGSSWYSAKLKARELAPYNISVQISQQEYDQAKNALAQKQPAFYSLKLHNGSLGYEWASDGHLVEARKN